MKFESSLLRESYQKITHKSGLRIYVFPKKLTTTYACLAAAFGSVDRTFRAGGAKKWTTVPAGTAHYLEHKLFDSPDGSDPFARFGALGADLNAYTNYTSTAYHFSTPEHFDLALEELFRLVLNPYFTAQTVQKERGIIAEEIRSGMDFPAERCMQNALEGLYRLCPVREEIAGTEQSIAKITADTLYECHRLFYQPSNLILCVCGDVTPEQVEKIADKMLPTPCPAIPVERAPVNEPEDACKSRMEVRMPVAKPLFYLATKDPILPADPAARLRRDAVATLLSDTLFSRSSAFYARLFEEGLLTPSFSAGYSGTDRFAMHTVCGESPDPDEVYRRVLQALENAKKNGLDPADFARAKRCLLADEIRAFDSTEEIGYNLLSFALEGVDLFSYLPLVESVTLAECQALLTELFLPGRSCLSLVLPK